MTASLKATGPTALETTVPSLPAVRVLGVPLAVTDYESAMDWLDTMIARRERGYVCVGAVHMVMVCQDDPEARSAILGASLRVPDGQPLVWALKALGHDPSSRIYGPELMARYCERSARTGTRMFLYGGRNQGGLVQLVLNLRRWNPALKIVGGYAPPYRELEPHEEDALVEEINASGADVVWVGIGLPKQDKWMARMRERLDPPLLIGVGAAFDIHAGMLSQAPGWMQASGLEWVFRLVHEPRRLWRRYARYNPRFITSFTRQYLRHRRAPTRA